VEDVNHITTEEAEEVGKNLEEMKEKNTAFNGLIQI
jgi:hypothetical protein